MTDNAHDEHQSIREALGSYALGHLTPAERDRIGAHLDGCGECRLELDEISGLAALLSQVDPERFNSPPVPPADLGEKIRASLSAETVARDADDLAQRRSTHQRRRRTLARTGVVAAAAVLVAGVAGVAIGRGTAPDPTAVPMEAISMTSTTGSGVDVDDAVLIDHTWGLELRIEASGFERGETYQASFRSESGELTPAGEFLGIGSDELLCNLQSAIMREDVTSVLVTDETGSIVLRSRL